MSICTYCNNCTWREVFNFLFLEQVGVADSSGEEGVDPDAAQEADEPRRLRDGDGIPQFIFSPDKIEENSFLLTQLSGNKGQLLWLI
jgi:hypothetical protein